MVVFAAAGTAGVPVVVFAAAEVGANVGVAVSGASDNSSSGNGSSGSSSGGSSSFGLNHALTIVIVEVAASAVAMVAAAVSMFTRKFL